MAPTVCVCIDGPASGVIVSILKKKLEGQVKEIIASTKVADFAAVKADNDGIVPVVMGRSAHDVIKDLCDDYAQPQRRVKFIYSASAGVDAYRLPELKTELEGIEFCNAQGCYSNTLAEHVVFSMLYFNRYPWRIVGSKDAKKWDEFNMIELSNQKAVVVGYGDIGQACGRKAAALGVHVTGIRRTGDNKVDENGVMVRNNDALDESIREADFVIGVLPGTAQTKHFFNKDVFAKMKPSAVFINIGRGQTQCEVDIVEALEKGVIRGAALDVFETEPLPQDSPIWTVPNDKLLLTAHCADYTVDLFDRAMARFMKIFADHKEHGMVNTYTVSTHHGY